MRIYLIGLPGVGKSTIGKELANRLGYTFIDLDLWIEQKAMMFVDEIFHAYGEAFFRALEHNALQEALQEDNAIIACGGGVIKQASNKDVMQGICIYLYAEFSEIENRLKESLIERPLLQSKTLLDLYEERKSLYEAFADYLIENKSMEDTIQKIVEVIQGEKGINH